MAIPYTQVDADLVKLMQERVSAAVLSVLQLAESPGQGFQLALAASSSTSATLAGAWAAYKNIDLKTLDPIDCAIAVLELTKDAK